MNSADDISTTNREYGLTNGQRFQYLALAALFLFGAGFFFKLAIDPVGRDFALLVGLASLVPGSILALVALRSRLTLDGDRIELRSALRIHSAARSEIEGLRTVQNQYGRWVRICLKEGGGAFNVSSSFTGNDELKEWLKGLPDLDQRDADQITQQVDSLEPPGVAGNDRLDTLKRAKVWAVGLTVAAGLLSVPVMFVSYAPLYAVSLASLALFPLLGIALVLRFPLFFTIFKKRIDPRADIGFVLLWPGIGMLFSYKTGNDPTHLIDFFQLSYWVLLILGCYAAALFRIPWENSSRWGALAGILIFGGIYSVGVVNTANTLPDRSAPQLYQTEVTNMYETHGRNASSYLRLAPWGPLEYAEDVDVTKSVYEKTKVGDPVCVGLHPGFLHAPWYAILPCPQR